MNKSMIYLHVFKFFSLNRVLRDSYRLFGNFFGNIKRSQEEIEPYYLHGLNYIIALNNKYHFLNKDTSFLDIGTGWLHWDSIVFNLLFGVKSTAFDICDNRQFLGFKNYFNQLLSNLDTITIDGAQREKIREKLQKMLCFKSFDEMYEFLGMKYIINKTGRLDIFDVNSFDFSYSGGVLQHIGRDQVPSFIRDLTRITKKGGYSFHYVNLCDILFFYDAEVHKKQYLSYDVQSWKRKFENPIQYINRYQRSEWLNFFNEAGFVVVNEDSTITSLDGLTIDDSYKDFEPNDLEYTTLKILLQKR